MYEISEHVKLDEVIVYDKNSDETQDETMSALYMESINSENVSYPNLQFIFNNIICSNMLCVL